MKEGSKGWIDLESTGRAKIKIKRYALTPSQKRMIISKTRTRTRTEARTRR